MGTHCGYRRTSDMAGLQVPYPTPALTGSWADMTLASQRWLRHVGLGQRPAAIAENDLSTPAQVDLSASHRMFPLLPEVLPVNHSVYSVVAEVRMKSLNLTVNVGGCERSSPQDIKDCG